MTGSIRKPPEGEGIAPCFHTVDPKVNAMIVRMSAEEPGWLILQTSSIHLILTSATGQDYRHKLRDSGLLHG